MSYINKSGLTTTKPPKPKGKVSSVSRSGHSRGTAGVTSHTRRLANGRTVLVSAHKRSPTSVASHTKSGKGYGVREKRLSGKMDYKRKKRGAEKASTTRRTTRKR